MRVANSEETRLIDQAVNQTNATLQLQLPAANEKAHCRELKTNADHSPEGRVVLRRSETCDLAC